MTTRNQVIISWEELKELRLMLNRALEKIACLTEWPPSDTGFAAWLDGGTWIKTRAKASYLSHVPWDRIDNYFLPYGEVEEYFATQFSVKSNEDTVLQFHVPFLDNPQRKQ